MRMWIARTPFHACGVKWAWCQFEQIAKSEYERHIDRAADTRQHHMETYSSWVSMEVLRTFVLCRFQNMVDDWESCETTYFLTGKIHAMKREYWKHTMSSSLWEGAWQSIPSRQGRQCSESKVRLESQWRSDWKSRYVRVAPTTFAETHEQTSWTLLMSRNLRWLVVWVVFWGKWKALCRRKKKTSLQIKDSLTTTQFRKAIPLSATPKNTRMDGKQF